MNGQAKLPNVAIIGRPNVGKSALFNRLVGRKIAIVHDQPGITRDRISAICERGARPFTVWDTGGIFGAGEVELTGQVRSAVEEALRESNLLLFVVDAKDGLTPVDEELARMLRKSQKPVLLTINKIDHDKHEPLAVDFDSLGFNKNVSISAEHNRGVVDLLEQISQLLPDVRNQKSEVRGQGSEISEQPISIAIIGRPNVGKSSFINAILQSERAIVSELPGTTRDSVDIAYQRDGRQFRFIDTAGMRRRGKVSSSVEVFSVMRAERSIQRADLCVLIVDLTSGVTAQDKRIAGLIQEARTGALIVLNKWDLVKPRRGARETIRELADEARERIFFVDYAPVVIASARTGENVERLFGMIDKIERASKTRIGTGVLNRLMRAAIAANPPPMVKGKRLKLLYATQSGGSTNRPLPPPEFVLFVNDRRLLARTYARYLEAQIREHAPYPGLPIILTLRPRSQKL
ncbi:MAG TPA: ribosome biogenesis GTPase Der [Chthoniobacterales bacterium]|nr:ribosome biogenesis GTPase Der [Chthoniobacterales bacterium]